MGNSNLANHMSKYYQSFSGTDTLAFIVLPGCSPVLIGSLSTISYSMYRNKKPVINIGRTNINGVTRGSRIFAGTMIFTLINQHWLKEIQQQGSTWLSDYGYTQKNGEWVPDDSYDLKVDELPLFDIIIISANEYGNAVAMQIYGIDFTDEAQTISVEDLFTENVFSFVARDISNFKSLKHRGTSMSKGGKNKYNAFSQRFYVLKSSNIELDDLAKLEKELSLTKITQLQQDPKRYVLARDLYFSSSKAIMGNDVADVQLMLNQTKLMTIPVNGIFDSATDEAVRKYQSYIGVDINGIVDSKLYNALMNQITGTGVRLGVVVNKHGAFVYRNASLKADIVDTKIYKEHVSIYKVVTSDDEEFHRWYKVSTGYILEEDVYSSYYTGNIIEFPKLQYQDSGVYVTMVQSALAKLYPAFTEINGTYDYETQEKIKQLQEDNGMVPTGVVDYNTWLLLQSLSDDISTEISSDNFKIEFNTLPGIYNISSDDILDKLSMFDATASCDNYITIKLSAVCIYDDETSKTLTKSISVKETTKLSLEDLKNAFVYNPEYGKIPLQVDYIIYPYNKKSYKWTIMYS